MEKALVLIRKNFLTIEWVKIQCEIKLTWILIMGLVLLKIFRWDQASPIYI